MIDSRRTVHGVALLGCALRLFHYLRDPSVWHDEAALIVNVLERNFLDGLRLRSCAEPLHEVADPPGPPAPRPRPADPGDPRVLLLRGQGVEAGACGRNRGERSLEIRRNRERHGTRRSRTTAFPCGRPRKSI